MVCGVCGGHCLKDKLGHFECNSNICNLTFHVGDVDVRFRVVLYIGVLRSSLSIYIKIRNLNSPCSNKIILL